MNKKDEYDQWLKGIKYVNQEMCFFTWQDFIKDAPYLKNMYLDLTLLEKMIYRMYVYSRREISKSRIDCIWNYLNGDYDYEKLTRM